MYGRVYSRPQGARRAPRGRACGLPESAGDGAKWLGLEGVEDLIGCFPFLILKFRRFGWAEGHISL